MPLIKCPECENEISDKVDTVCPKCGYTHDKAASLKLESKNWSQLNWFFRGLMAYVIIVFAIVVIMAITGGRGQIIIGGALLILGGFIIYKFDSFNYKNKLFFIGLNTLFSMIIIFVK